MELAGRGSRLCGDHVLAHALLRASGNRRYTGLQLHRWNRTRRVVNRIRKDFKLLAHGEVLDKAAGRYNLSRKPGETDKDLRERILKTIKEVRTT